MATREELIQGLQAADAAGNAADAQVFADEIRKMDAATTSAPAPVTFGGTAKAAGQGVLEGGYDVLGLPGDLSNAVGLQGKRMGETGMTMQFPGRDQVQNLFSKFMPDYKPQNQVERYTMAGTRGATQGFMPGGPAKMGVSALFGMLTGLGEEAGRTAMGDSTQGDQAGAAIGSAIPAVAAAGIKSSPWILPKIVKDFLPAALTKLAESTPYLAIAKSLLTANATRPPIRPLGMDPSELSQ